MSAPAPASTKRIYYGAVELVEMTLIDPEPVLVPLNLTAKEATAMGLRFDDEKQSHSRPRPASE